MPTPPYYLVFDGTVGRGNWATYAYVDGSLAIKEQELINLKYYTDASLHLRDLSINDLYAGIGVGYNAMKIYTDGSLAQRDASITDLYGKIGLGYNNMKIYVDGSLATLKAYTDASIIGLKAYTNNEFAIRDIDISAIQLHDVMQDGSIVRLFNQNFQQDLSIGALFVENDAQDVSIAYLSGFRFLHNLLDVSIVDVSANNVLEFDGSIGFWKNAFPEEIDTYFYNKLYMDASALFRNSPMETSSATAIRFDKAIGYVYGTISSPITSSLTLDSTNPILGATNLVIHKAASLSVPGTFKHLAGVYSANVNNFIYIQYVDNNNQLYSVSQIY
jgi:hypothetical protein